MLGSPLEPPPAQQAAEEPLLQHSIISLRVFMHAHVYVQCMYIETGLYECMLHDKFQRSL